MFSSNQKAILKRWVKEKEPEKVARETGIMDFLDAFMIVATVSLIFIVCIYEKDHRVLYTG